MADSLATIAVPHTKERSHNSVRLRGRIGIVLSAFCYYAVVGFVGEMFPALREGLRLVSVAVDGIVIVAGFSLLPSLQANLRKDVTLPLFLFLGLGGLTYLSSQGLFGIGPRSLVLHLNGIRSYLAIFATYAILSAAFASSHRDDVVRWMRTILVIFAVVQIPVTVYQVLTYGAGDYVGGTLSEGGSGTITQMLFLISFYFLNVSAVSKRTGSIQWARSLPFLLLLVPVFLNETKISFIFLTAYFLLASDLRRRAIRGIVIIGSLVLLLIVFMSVYVDVTGLEFEEYFSQEFVYDYLFETDVAYDNFGTEEYFDIGRMARIVLLFEYWQYEPGRIMLGEGYGVLKGQNVLGADTTSFLMYLLYGSKNLIFTFLVQGGMMLLIAATVFVARLVRRMRVANISRPMNRLRLFILFQVLIAFLYNDALLYPHFSTLLMFLVFAVQTEPPAHAVDSGRSIRRPRLARTTAGG